jgi:hypothetical protein
MGTQWINTALTSNGKNIITHSEIPALKNEGSNNWEWENTTMTFLLREIMFNIRANSENWYFQTFEEKLAMIWISRLTFIAGHCHRNLSVFPNLLQISRRTLCWTWFRARPFQIIFNRHRHSQFAPLSSGRLLSGEWIAETPIHFCVRSECHDHSIVILQAGKMSGECPWPKHVCETTQISCTQK